MPQTLVILSKLPPPILSPPTQFHSLIDRRSASIHRQLDSYQTRLPLRCFLQAGRQGLGACGSRGRKGNKARRRLAGYQRRRLAGKRRRRSASYQGCGFCSRVRIDVGGSPTGVDRHCLWY
ncbi:hypothetical protein LINGRAHAP2_LOCUS19277 [Linum grandiflorum]